MKKIICILLSCLVLPVFAGKVTEIRTMPELALLASPGKPIVIVFTAKWCPQCKLFDRTYQKLASQSSFLSFYEIDLDNRFMTPLTRYVPGVPMVAVLKKAPASKGAVAAFDTCVAFSGNYTLEDAQKSILQCLRKFDGK